jgi:exopolysaccharide biosynthesis polyprenyl glycosylphosphotransferase
VRADADEGGALRVRYRLVPPLVATDLLALASATGLALAINAHSSATVRQAALWAAVTVVATECVFVLTGLYERERNQIVVSSLDEVRHVFSALTFVGFAELAIAEVFRLGGLPLVGPETLLLFWLCAIILVPLSRGFLRHKVLPRFGAAENAIIVGAGYVGQSIATKILAHQCHNVRVVGFLDDNPQPLDPQIDHLPILGGEHELIQAIERFHVSRVVLAFSRRSPEAVLKLLRAEGLRDVSLSIVPRYFEITASNAGVTDVDGIPVLELPAARLSRLARLTKRSFDVLLSLSMLILLAPLLALIALAVKLDSKGPVLFRQRRMGCNGRAFEIVKFRTMETSAELMRDDLLPQNESPGPLFKIRDDPRVTRVGGVLRKFCLDELPQLWNVLKGEMSLVGPRPFVVDEDAKIDGWARRRLDLKPGITGVWQVLGRHDLEFDEMVRLDYLYVSNWSLWWDVKLMVRTVPIVFGRQGY